MENKVFIQQPEPVMVKINVTLKPCPVPAINCVCGLGPEEQVQGVLVCNESSHKHRSTGVCVCFWLREKNVCDVMGADLSQRWSHL